MHFILSKFGVVYKSVEGLFKLAIYTLDYYNDINVPLPSWSITFSPLNLPKKIIFFCRKHHFCVSQRQDCNGCWKKRHIDIVVIFCLIYC